MPWMRLAFDARSGRPVLSLGANTSSQATAARPHHSGDCVDRPPAITGIANASVHRSGTSTGKREFGCTRRYAAHSEAYRLVQPNSRFPVLVPLLWTLEFGCTR